MAFPTRLTKVGHGGEHFNERTGMCYHQTLPWERVVAHVGDAGQAKSHLEHNPLSLLGARNTIPMRKLNDPALFPLPSCAHRARHARRSAVSGPALRPDACLRARF